MLIRRLFMRPEFRDVNDARIVALTSQLPVKLHGHDKAAVIGVPKVQGTWRQLFAWLVAEMCRPVLEGEDPEFLVLFDAALWTSLTPVAQERLVYHELLHLRVKSDPETGELRRHDDGRFQLEIAPHDHEVFDAEVERYGAEICGLETLCTAIIKGQETIGRKLKRRKSA